MTDMFALLLMDMYAVLRDMVYSSLDNKEKSNWAC